MDKEDLERLFEESYRAMKKRHEKVKIDLMNMFGNKWKEEYRRLEMDKEQTEYEYFVGRDTKFGKFSH